jgi:hypothetical protein
VSGSGQTSLMLTAIIRGDFSGDGLVTAADIPAMLSAPTNLRSYASSKSLSLMQLAAIGDFDNSGSVMNRDIQGLLDLVAGLGGGSVAAVPRPSTFLLAALGLAGVLSHFHSGIADCSLKNAYLEAASLNHVCITTAGAIGEPLTKRARQLLCSLLAAHSLGQ